MCECARESLNAAQLRAVCGTRQAKRVVVVDVREAAETAVSMIPGAVTKEQFEAEAERYAQHTVVAYCTIGYRSGKYCQELGKQDRPEPVLNLQGRYRRPHNSGYS